MARRRQIRAWRVVTAGDQHGGLLVYFDPTRERLRLYELDPKERQGVRETCERDEPEDSMFLH